MPCHRQPGIYSPSMYRCRRFNHTIVRSGNSFVKFIPGMSNGQSRSFGCIFCMHDFLAKPMLSPFFVDSTMCVPSLASTQPTLRVVAIHDLTIAKGTTVIQGFVHHRSLLNVLYTVVRYTRFRTPFVINGFVHCR